MTHNGAVRTGTSGLAITALILGILALITSLVPIFNNVSFFVGIVGLILGIAGLVSVNRKGTGGKGLAIAGIIISVLACILVLASQAVYSSAVNQAAESFNESVDELNQNIDRSSGNATESILENELDVQIGSLTITEKQFGNDSSLPVVVTNKADEPLSFSIHIEAIGPDGSRLDSDYIYGNNLGAGQAQTFEIFTFIPSDEVEAMRNATFDVVSVSAY